MEGKKKGGMEGAERRVCKGKSGTRGGIGGVLGVIGWLRSEQTG